MAYGTVNADVIQTSTSGGILGAGDASLMKNRIINGAMVINQRAFSGSVDTTNPYTLDRWQGVCSASSKYTVSQNAGSVTPPAGFTNYLGVTSSAATTVGSGDYYFLAQYVEGFNSADLGWGTANAKTVTLSFQVYSSLTGTFGGSLRNNASDRSYPFSYTVSAANTWTTISVTVAGDTTGTWVGATNGIGIRVGFGLGLGSTLSGTAGAWAAGNYIAPTGATQVVATNGATFYITGVQLEVGSSATGFEYVNYQTSLANCQRYYQKLVSNDQSPAGYGNVDTASAFQITIPSAVQMRTTPTYTDSTGRFRYNGNNITPSGYTPYSVNSNLVNILASTSGASTNYAGTFTCGSGSTLSAEL